MTFIQHERCVKLQVTSNRNVGQGEGSLETQFLSFPSGGRG